MTPIGKAGELERLIREVRSTAQAYSSNCFAPSEQIASWLACGDTVVEAYPDCVVLMKPDRDFHHVLHFAGDLQALQRALASLAIPRGSAALAADLVGRVGVVEPVVAAYEAAGFARHRRLLRMARPGVPDVGSATPDDDATLACEADGGDVIHFLEGLLDRFSEQIPTASEARQAAARGEVLLARAPRGLAGVLWYELQGQAARLRYWWLQPEARNAGVGARLLRGMFRRIRSAKRVTLWVVADNGNGISRYRHYGFEFDGLADQVMLKKGTS